MNVSRQRMEQLRNVANGMCAYHKNRPLANTRVCHECMLKEIAAKGIKKPHPKKSDWLRVDWNLSDKEIAEKMNITPQCVAWRRKQHCKPKVAGERRQRWWRVNWTYSNAEIAAALNVTPNAVRIQRRKIHQ